MNRNILLYSIHSHLHTAVGCQTIKDYSSFFLPVKWLLPFRLSILLLIYLSHSLSLSPQSLVFLLADTFFDFDWSILFCCNFSYCRYFCFCFTHGGKRWHWNRLLRTQRPVKPNNVSINFGGVAKPRARMHILTFSLFLSLNERSLTCFLSADYKNILNLTALPHSILFLFAEEMKVLETFSWSKPSIDFSPACHKNGVG